MKILEMLWVSFLLLPGPLSGALLPAVLLKLDDYFSHHVLVVEKSTHKLHLYKNEGGIPKWVKSVKIATGKKTGDKIFQGDHRTPEGIYQLTAFLTHRNLLERYGKEGEVYGVGAFVLNYPNPMDSHAGKTGDGIWIHSTNDETRIELGLDSRGCVVTANDELIKLSRYIELNRTSIVVVHNLNFLSQEAWDLEQKRILKTLEGWREAWQDEDIKSYLSYYHSREFRDPIRGSFPRFRRYKTSLFAAPGRPTVRLSDIAIMATNHYAVVSFRQHYKSRSIDDVGKKLLYIKKDAYYNWRIVSEVWTKLGIDREKEPTIAFGPSQRFFDTENPSDILDIKYTTQSR